MTRIEVELKTLREELEALRRKFNYHLLVQHDDYEDGEYDDRAEDDD
jgi:hypothetical protein